MVNDHRAEKVLSPFPTSFLNVDDWFEMQQKVIFTDLSVRHGMPEEETCQVYYQKL